MIGRTINTITGSNAQYTPTVKDTFSRKLFFSHEQSISSKRWIVRHGFGPSTAIIVYDHANNIIDSDLYRVNYSRGESIITFESDVTGIVHVLSRNGDGGSRAAPLMERAQPVQTSFSDTMTFAIPRYITRLNSGSTAPLSPVAVQVTPTPTPVPLPGAAPYEICNNSIRIEVEVTRPNESSITCSETLDDGISVASSWFGWPRILVGSRRHYCTRTLKFSSMRIFSNVNNQKVVVPDNTTIRIKRIDYGTGVFTNIPDRGLLVLLSDGKGGKILDSVIDIGEMVGTQNDFFTFKNGNTFVDANRVEIMYPDIKRLSI